MHYYLIRTKDNQREVVLNSDDFDIALFAVADLLKTSTHNLECHYNEDDLHSELIRVMENANNGGSYNIGYLDSRLQGFNSKLSIDELVCCNYIPYQSREEKIDKLFEPDNQEVEK